MAGRPLTILLAGPRGFCAGVDRAIQIVERAIERFGTPVYVRHEIVHNRFVVDTLRAKGAVFVEELDAVPDDRPVVFSAHGVPKAVPDEARRRNMIYLDATCPLVSKVHREAERHFADGRQIVLIGHAGHPEVIGTMGQLPPGAVLLVEDADDEEKKTKKQKDEKTKKKDKKDKKSKKGDDASQDAAASAATEASAHEDPFASVHPVCVSLLGEKDGLRVEYTVVEGEAAGHASLLLRVTNTSSAPLTGVNVDVSVPSAAAPESVRVAKGASPAALGAPLAPNASATLCVGLRVGAGLVSAQELAVTVGHEGAPKLLRKKGAVVPPSVHVVPVKMTVEDLAELLGRRDGSCDALASTRLVLRSATLADALKLVARVLNVRLIEARNFTATYYGHSDLLGPVAVLVKSSREEAELAHPTLAVDVKTATAAFSAALIAELQARL